jgi:Holliday junction resolvase RusA-like endonuclease
LTIPGNPVSKGRPRVGRGWVHTPKRTRDAEEWIRFWARKAGIRKPLRGPIHLDVAFYRADKRRADGDNLLKLLQDAGNGIMWGDDAQITSMSVRKLLDHENPRTEVFATELAA